MNANPEQKLSEIPEFLRKRGSDIEEILANREKNYGAYAQVSAVSQMLKKAMEMGPKWNQLYPHQKESLEMIANKISRIVNGDREYADSWIDISGYAELVVKELKK